MAVSKQSREAPTPGADVAGRERVAVRRILRVDDGGGRADDDALTAEEPLEIRIGELPIAVVMRTPCDDFELAAGFLLTEQIVSGPADLAAISYCPTAEPPNLENVVDVRLAAGVEFDREAVQRNFYASSSCGICGKASIAAVLRGAEPLPVRFQVDRSILGGLSGRMRQAQQVFERTGSLHAAALFDPAGELLVLREDVGRHNAVDKVVGSYVVRNATLPPACVLMVSGRASFEVMQKAHAAGIPFVAAVSAPSSLAVDLACDAGMTLVGFLRDRSFNVYAGAERISGVTQPQQVHSREG